MAFTGTITGVVSEIRNKTQQKGTAVLDFNVKWRHPWRNRDVAKEDYIRIRGKSAENLGEKIRTGLPIRVDVEGSPYENNEYTNTGYSATGFEILGGDSGSSNNSNNYQNTQRSQGGGGQQQQDEFQPDDELPF